MDSKSNLRRQLKNLRQEKPKARRAPEKYADFDQLDGVHPWQDKVPEGYILYPARKIPQAKVAYFNYALAKEMGLIDEDHPDKLNPELEKKIISTFSIRIINEYDQKENVIYPTQYLKPNSYMATRYLQLQHADKSGRTSGDGRCIWNGVIEHKGKLWDVSSRGTGVTALAPGVVEAGKPLPSGCEDYGYSCGLAEIDELYGAAIMAEIFHNNGIHTERVLAILDHGKGMGIGVRAGLNLIRPAHLFLYLKQGLLEPLKNATDYLIDRQYKNKVWHFSARHPRRLDLMLEELCERFAQFAAQLDRDYIFAWLDWDGDNVLADAGIIDYGSIRQFGLRHDQYRYDDSDRFSTNLTEQKHKARLTIQVFAQMLDFLKTGNRKSLQAYAKHPILKKFDSHFNYYKLDRFLYNLGFSRAHRENLLKTNQKDVQAFFNNYAYFEKVKTYKKLKKVADGINRPAIFNMRSISRELPSYWLKQTDPKSQMPAEEFFRLMLSSQAKGKDARMTERLGKRIRRFQTQYLNLIQKASPSSVKQSLKQLNSRAEIINRADRITGNALINLVDDILSARKKGYSPAQIQRAMDELIRSQCLNPEVTEQFENSKLHLSRRSQELVVQFLTVLDGCKEDI